MLEDASVIVVDLDGVLRHFDPDLFGRLDHDHGLQEGTAYRAILGSPHLGEVIRGRSDHATWQAHARRALRESGISDHDASELVHTWLSSPATPDADVVAALRRARGRGAEVFIFTNGTDRVATEIADLHLDEFSEPGGAHLINSYDLHAAKPELRAFKRAHRHIETALGRTIPERTVLFMDDRLANVEAAQRFGWNGMLYEQCRAE